MVHTFIGNLGHLFVIISFVTSIVAAFAYYKASQSFELNELNWKKYARSIFYIHAASVLGVFVVLYLIIQNHYFEYHYAWSHSSLNLPPEYMISCFWEGQEGSFLLWAFWQAVIGIVLIATNKKWEAPVMAVFALVQAFLASMILGVVIFNFKLGSSPFILLRDAIDAPIFQSNPNFVPQDGNGLNPLLQNYWMVIHPPTLFLGFAASLVPFAFAIAGLWKKKFSEWIRPALPWTIFGTAILGLGILMGAYWAYETLNFGGYWNWDPVENAVYVPWLIMVASIHTMIAYKKSNTALKTSIILVIVSFILILYSTFLTRSGILGNASVHSFTDLGLSGQLLMYLIVFLVLSVFLVVFRWKDIPTDKNEVSSYSREFWIFIGVTTLCLMGFQVLIPTSFPVFNRIVELFGGHSNLAPPADQILFYTKFQLWFGFAVAILSGTGQFFWWKKIDKQKLQEVIIVPIVITLLLSALIISIGGIRKIEYILLVTAGIYSIVSNTKILLSLKRTNLKLSGGSVSHIGIAMILIGILFSSGYSKILSMNRSGQVYSSSEELNQENVLLWLNEPYKMGPYQLVYKGQKMKIDGFGEFIDKDNLIILENPYNAVVTSDILKDGEKIFSIGDTVGIRPENTYYKVEYKTEKGDSFSLYPRAQINPSMGLLSSPDIKRGAFGDLYTHVSSIPDPEQEPEWSDSEEIQVSLTEKFFIKDYIAYFTGIERIEHVHGVKLEPHDVAVKGVIKILADGKEYLMEPAFIIKDKNVGRIPATNNDLGIKITLNMIHPDANTFSLAVNTTQKDYIILKAMEKPFINILWIGTIVLMFGFGIALYRRYNEFMLDKDKKI